MNREKLQALASNAIGVAIDAARNQRLSYSYEGIIGPVAGAILAAALAETNSADIKIALLGRENA